MRQLLNNSQWFAVSLSNWASMGDWRLFFVHRDRIEEVTPEDMTRVAGIYLVATNATVGTYVPTEEPTRVAVASVSDEELRAIVEGYESSVDQDQLAVEPLERPEAEVGAPNEVG